MISVIIISLLTAISLMAIILIKPSVNTKNGSFDIYWIIPIVGAVLLLALNKVDFESLKQGFFSNNASNPLKLLVLFFSMSAISVYLDETGFFEYLASVASKRAKSSQKTLFLIMYVTISILTVFTSNDIVILTFTPFICKFSKQADINPIPYIVAEFVAANTWSMLFIIGNPTNIFLAQAKEIQFIDYFLVMWLPTIFSGVSSYLVLRLLFAKMLKKPLSTSGESCQLPQKTLSIIGLVHLLLCTIVLAISGYIKIEMWLISLAFAVSLFVVVIIYRLAKREKPLIILKTIKRLPYQLAPTVIGMFVVVLALNNCGATEKISQLLGNSYPTLKYGVLSTLAANLMNNIPMSVLFASISPSLGGVIAEKAVYSTIIGSNLGAILTPMGALAGIMFTSILKRNDVKFGFREFVKYGVIITAISLFAALGGLELSFLINA